MKISRQGSGWVKIILSNEKMRFSYQGVVKKDYSKRENEMFLSGGWGEMIFKIIKNIQNEQMRIFSPGGWVEIIFSNEQMRISHQGVVEREYSYKRTRSSFQGDAEKLFKNNCNIKKNYFNSKKSFLQARKILLLNRN
jgi:hypothetical protein